MAIKRASKSRSSAPAEFEPEMAKKFVSAEARKRFEQEVKERLIHEEKGFILHGGKDFGLPTAVADVIRAHKWKSFAAHP